VILTAEPPVRRRVRRDPKPHFKPDVSRQLDAEHGCPEVQVPSEHLARAVRRIVDAFDTSSLEAGYSSLGRHGFHPRQVLAVWIYGSLVGLHESTKVANAMQTDAAFRLLAGGHVISAGTLRRFRGRNGAFFEAAIAQTVRMANDLGLLRTDELGVDSVRLRAHASTSEARTLVRSRKRLAELLATALDQLSPDERARHEAKVRKHEQAIARCEAEGRTNFVVTSPSAGLLKFPDGASAPGHRVTVVAAGVRERLVLNVLMDADSHDFGKAAVLLKTRALLDRLGISSDAGLQAALDAGYWSEEDLQFAAANRDWIDILIAERRDDNPKFFGRDKFTEHGDGTISCPVDRLMRGPYADGVGRGQRYEGVGCADCSLKAQCTSSSKRTLVVRKSFDEARRLMRERLAAPGAKARYNQRIATIEPVFAHLESTMKYRRTTTRHERGVIAEVLLKLLAHNVSRLINARPLLRAFVVLDAF
jgi:transposase